MQQERACGLRGPADGLRALAACYDRAMRFVLIFALATPVFAADYQLKATPSTVAHRRRFGWTVLAAMVAGGILVTLLFRASSQRPSETAPPEVQGA